MNSEKYIYVYNIKQANYFITNGLKVEEIGFNRRKTYVKFKAGEELYEIFERWNNEKSKDIAPVNIQQDTVIGIMY